MKILGGLFRVPCPGESLNGVMTKAIWWGGRWHFMHTTTMPLPCITAALVIPDDVC